MRIVLSVLALAVVGMAGCATTPPVELIQARTACNRASFGPAAQLAPADLRKASLALNQAERAFADEKDLPKTVDLAYIAERTAQIAEAHAQTALTEKKMATQAAGTLTTTRAELAEARRGEAQQAQQIGIERTARVAAEEKADASERKAQASEQKAEASEQKAGASDEKAVASEQMAQQAGDALARLSAKPVGGGMVITLAGNVLFRSNGAHLLPAAMRRLDEVASVLAAQEQNVVVEGFTDSKGSAWSNVDLSRRRAEAVRAYLVSRGCPPDRIVARGLGPDRPIADNATGEGRASNRRVEIVINRP